MEVASKYRPNCPNWIEDVQDVLTELRGQKYHCLNRELEDAIFEEIQESLIAWGIPSDEFHIHVSEILDVIPTGNNVPIF